MSKKSRKHNNDKPKRPTRAQQRAGLVIMQIEPDLSGMSAYKTKPPRRHRGPITAGAIAGTGQGSLRRSKRSK